MHDDQLDLSADTVRRLVADRFPQWAGESVTEVVAAGTVNAVFRIGGDLVGRFPLRAHDPREASAALHAERSAALKLLGRSRFATPEPVAVGEPGHGYPMPWSVWTWLPGRTATPDVGAGSPEFAADLAEFVVAVRTIPVDGEGFRGSGRGGDLRDHDAWVAECLQRSADLLDTEALAHAWDRFRALPRETPDATTHGDLVPGNLLVTGTGPGTRLSGVLDVGGLGPTDPALDLVGAWHLLDAPAREVLRRTLGAGDLEWARGAAWAFEQALGLVWYYLRSNPSASALGRSTLDRLLADPVVGG